MRRGLGIASLLLVQLGCCPTPTAVVAAGVHGPYARFLPAEGNASPDARAGLGKLIKGWPPELPGKCTSSKDELKDLETALGVSPVACPALEQAYAPGVGTEPGPEAEGEPFAVRCYPLGGALLVVEAAGTLFDCRHIVGLGVFRKEP